MCLLLASCGFFITSLIHSVIFVPSAHYQWLKAAVATRPKMFHPFAVSCLCFEPDVFLYVILAECWQISTTCTGSYTELPQPLRFLHICWTFLYYNLSPVAMATTCWDLSYQVRAKEVDMTFDLGDDSGSITQVKVWKYQPGPSSWLYYIQESIVQRVTDPALLVTVSGTSLFQASSRAIFHSLKTFRTNCVHAQIIP